jgi:hypothetical protein
MTLPRQANKDVIEDLARRTAAHVELVKGLYVPVIENQRVRRTLQRSARDVREGERPRPARCSAPSQVRV